MNIDISTLIRTESPNVEDVRDFLAEFQNWDSRVFENDSPLCAAVKMHRRDLIQLMIQDFGMNVNAIVKSKKR